MYVCMYIYIFIFTHFHHAGTLSLKVQLRHREATTVGFTHFRPVEMRGSV